MQLERRRLCQRLGHQFQQPELLDQALTHRSFGGQHNERLEFLGDAVLGLIIGEALYRRFPALREGELSRLRALLVREQTLAELANEMAMGACLRLGGGELKSGGFRRDSILADALEAVIGALYLETGLATTSERVLGWYRSRLDSLTPATAVKDAKTRLQEWLQAKSLAVPRYEVTATEGAEHNQLFHVICHIDALSTQTRGSGNSRRKAEQQAAEQALKSLS